MKKTISVLLAVLLAASCVTVYAAADTHVTVRLFSDLNGKTAADYTAFAAILGGNIVFDTEAPAGPVSVYDYAGTAVSGALKAGRTYYVDYLFKAADGAVLPAALTDGDLTVECGKGASLLSYEITRRLTANGLTDGHSLVLHVKVIADGSALQRAVGLLMDLIAKLRAWSLY